MDPLLSFLKQGYLPEDRCDVKKIRRKALRYWLSDEQKLYKCSHSGPYLLCIHHEVVEPLLEELHEGICGSHTGGKSLSHRALTRGIGGQVCKKLPKIMLRSVTSVKDTPQIFISLEGS